MGERGHQRPGFVQDRRGSIGVYMAVAILPISLLVGAATDLRRVESMRNAVQDSADAAVLAAARTYITSGLGGGDRMAAARSAADGALNSNLGPAAGQLTSLDWTVNPNTAGELVLNAKARVPLAFGGLFGMADMPVEVTSASTAGAMKNLEVALVLDNTGSMRMKNKIGVLRTATVDMIDQLADVAALNPDRSNALKIALVPFSMTVKLDDPAGYQGRPWLDGQARGPGYNTPAPLDRWSGYGPAGWGGCVESRPYPHDVRDTQPSEGSPDTLYVPFYHLDTPGNPNRDCNLSPMKRLTGDSEGVKKAARAMVADGNTNIPLGLAWGWNALAPRGEGPFGDGVAYGDPKTIKAIVLMTDGQNNISTGPLPNGGPYSGVGLPSQERLKLPASSTLEERRDALDARLAELCANVKKKGVVIYSVRVDTPGSPDVMRNCATDPEKFFDVKKPEDLNAVFGAIAGSLLALRLAR